MEPNSLNADNGLRIIYQFLFKCNCVRFEMDECECSFIKLKIIFEDFEALISITNYLKPI